MKRMLVVIIVLLTALLSFAATGRGFDVKYQRVSDLEMRLDFTTNITISLVEIDGVKYSKINNGGNTVTNDKGFAEIPFHSATVQLKNNKNVKMKYSLVDYEDIALDYPLLPSRGTIFRNQDPSKIPYVIAAESVRDEWYPENVSEITDPFILRDVRGTNVLVYPYQYNSKTNTLRVHRNLTVSLIEDETEVINPIKNPSKSVVRDMDQTYRSLFINYNEDSKFTNQLGELGEILVIYTARDASAIQPYIDWKEENGFTVTEMQVATGTNVVSTIQNAYDANNNILYVQLVGDWADLTCNRGGGENEPMDPETGCVVGTDDYPDIIIGRFSAESTAQLTVQVDKGINYEKNPDLGGNWYKSALGIGSNDGSGIGDDDEIDWEQVDIIKDYKLLPYNYTTVNEAYGTPSAATVAGFVNNGLGLINYCGHGASTYWVTSGYDVADVYSSTNGNELPFIFSVACVNGSFDNPEEVFAEAWLRKSGGGAVAALMSTINQPWVPPMIGQDYFNDILTEGYNYSSNPGSGTSTTEADHRTTFGSVAFNGCILMLAENPSDINTQNTIKTWTIFGDASLQIRTDTPTLIDNSTTTLLPSNYSTTITAGGSPVEGAKITLYQNGTHYTGITDSNGDVSIDHNFPIASNVIVTVTGYNLETEQSTMMVTGNLGGTFSLDNSSLSFGNVTVGGSSTMQFTITNSHNSETIVGDITTITGYSVANAAKNTLSYAVPTNSSKTFDLVFSPAAESTYSGNITITSSDPSHDPEFISVSGTGALPDINVATTTTGTCAPDGTTSSLLSIQNTGSSNLTYSASFDYTGWPGMKADVVVEENDFESGLVYTNSGTWSVVSGEAKTSSIGISTLTSPVFDGSPCSDLYLDFDQASLIRNSGYFQAEWYDGSTWTQVYNTTSSSSESQHIAIPNTAIQVRFIANVTRSQGQTGWQTLDNVVVSGPSAYSWLTLDGGLTTNGVVAASGTDAITVGYDATGLVEGDYTADITIT
jgi:gingipain R